MNRPRKAPFDIEAFLTTLAPLGPQERYDRAREQRGVLEEELAHVKLRLKQAETAQPPRSSEWLLKAESARRIKQSQITRLGWAMSAARRAIAEEAAAERRTASQRFERKFVAAAKAVLPPEQFAQLSELAEQADTALPDTTDQAAPAPAGGCEVYEDGRPDSEPLV